MTTDQMSLSERMKKVLGELELITSEVERLELGDAANDDFLTR